MAETTLNFAFSPRYMTLPLPKPPSPRLSLATVVSRSPNPPSPVPADPGVPNLLLSFFTRIPLLHAGQPADVVPLPPLAIRSFATYAAAFSAVATIRMEYYHLAFQYQ